MNTDPTLRAANIIIEGRYLTLATADPDRAWATPVAYARGRDSRLYYYSARSARHSQNLRDAPLPSAAIFDSRASSDDADGVQLQINIDAISQEEVQSVHSHYYQTMWPDPVERANWEQSVQHFIGPSPLRFYGITILEAYVLDLDAYENVPEGQPIIDRRAKVDVTTLRRLIAYGDGSA